MSYQILHKTEFNSDQWDTLVARDTTSTIFSNSYYVDALAADWCIIVDDHWTGGMILPFKKRFGQRLLYTPNFMRYIEWIGEKPASFKDVFTLILSHFSIIDINFKENYFENLTMIAKVHQVLKVNDYQLNQQAKRMLKKETVEYRWDFDFRLQDLISLVSDELKNKPNAWHTNSSAHLLGLVQNLNKRKKLHTLTIWDNDKLLGGVFLMKHLNTVTYLKGTVVNEGKSKGWMFHLMNEAIQDAFQQNCFFDFGGSNVEGVKRFNCNFGAKDTVYFTYRKCPFWYKIINKIKKWLKK